MELREVGARLECGVPGRTSGTFGARVAEGREQPAHVGHRLAAGRDDVLDRRARPLVIATDEYARRLGLGDHHRQRVRDHIVQFARDATAFVGHGTAFGLQAQLRGLLEADLLRSPRATRLAPIPAERPGRPDRGHQESGERDDRPRAGIGFGRETMHHRHRRHQRRSDQSDDEGARVGPSVVTRCRCVHEHDEDGAARLQHRDVRRTRQARDDEAEHGRRRHDERRAWQAAANHDRRVQHGEEHDARGQPGDIGGKACSTHELDDRQRQQRRGERRGPHPVGGRGSGWPGHVTTLPGSPRGHLTRTGEARRRRRAGLWARVADRAAAHEQGDSDGNDAHFDHGGLTPATRPGR